MEERPSYIVAASVLALTGALFSLAVLISEFDILAEDFALRTGLHLLSVILFIGIAGSLNMNGQWSWRFLIFMEALCAAVPITALLFEFTGILYCAALVLISAVVIILTASNGARRWVEADRI